MTEFYVYNRTVTEKSIRRYNLDAVSPNVK